MYGHLQDTCPYSHSYRCCALVFCHPLKSYLMRKCDLGQYTPVSLRANNKQYRVSRKLHIPSRAWRGMPIEQTLSSIPAWATQGNPVSQNEIKIIFLALPKKYWIHFFKSGRRISLKKLLLGLGVPWGLDHQFKFLPIKKLLWWPRWQR